MKITPRHFFPRVDFAHERMELVPLIINPVGIETSGRNQLVGFRSERGLVLKH